VIGLDYQLVIEGEGAPSISELEGLLAGVDEQVKAGDRAQLSIQFSHTFGNFESYADHLNNYLINYGLKRWPWHSRIVYANAADSTWDIRWIKNPLAVKTVIIIIFVAIAAAILYYVLWWGFYKVLVPVAEIPIIGVPLSAALLFGGAALLSYTFFSSRRRREEIYILRR
jgi:hypothetical protein